MPEKDSKTEQQESMREMMREMVQEMFKGLAPVIQSVALTPDKLQEIKKPYVDPLDLARKLREQQQGRLRDAEAEKIKQWRQASCSHKDKKQQWTIKLQHNFPDHQPRGHCSLCEVVIEPAHYDYRPCHIVKADGSIETERSFIVPEHPLYHIVRQIESMS